MDNPALFKKIYQWLTWTSLAGLILFIILVFIKSPAPAVAVDPAAAARAEQKFAAADQAKAAGQPSSVALDSTELNSYLSKNLALAGSAVTAAAATPAPAAGDESSGSANAAPAASGGAADPAAVLSSTEQPTLEQVQSSVKDVKVDMDGDVVKAYVIFDFHGKDMSMELDGHLSAENGYMKFVPISGKLGSVPLPQSVLNEAVDKMMSSPENREKLKLPADISDLKIENGQAVVNYK